MLQNSTKNTTRTYKREVFGKKSISDFKNPIVVRVRLKMLDYNQYVRGIRKNFCQHLTNTYGRSGPRTDFTASEFIMYWAFTNEEDAVSFMLMSAGNPKRVKILPTSIEFEMHKITPV